MLPYIFGIGSLIEQASRIRTSPTAMYKLPARAHGFARGWWARTGAIGFSNTFVGAISEPSSSLNGVVYAVSEEELEATNKREKGYTPTDITKDVEILSGGSTPTGKVGSPSMISRKASGGTHKSCWHCLGEFEYRFGHL
jgi:cation transport regulator ChaC